MLSSNLQGAEQGQKGDIPKGCPAAVSQQSQKGPLYFSPFLPASTLPGEDVRKRRNAKQRSLSHPWAEDGIEGLPVQSAMNRA